MIVSAHQTHYWPYPGFFKKIMMSDLYILMGRLQFNKQSWQNRNRVMNQNTPGWLTVPVLTRHLNLQMINQVAINNDNDWKRKHFKSVELNYHNTPYYSQLREFLSELWLVREWDSLWDLNRYIIDYLILKLCISTPVKTDEDYLFQGSKTELLVSIVKQTGAGAYLSSPNAAAYIKPDVFKSHGIRHFYLLYQSPVYGSGKTPFFPDLSILDMICWLGFEGTRRYLRSDHAYFQDISRWWVVEQGK
ncbi:MAG: WbqC family protein [Candidatus Delongbacteria bacterium]|nr:WbqC family protein [Candidatus Delongbacteria bacterium]